MSWLEPGAAPPLTTWEILAWGGLLLGVIVSRIAVAPDFLYEWDSANYALSISDFDIYEHRPHAPGSPVFVLLLRLFGWLPGMLPFLALNLGFSIATLLLVGWLVRRSAGPEVALSTSVAFAVCAPFWHQGAASTAYTAECFLSVFGAAIAVTVARGGMGVALGGFLTAFSLGIRPGDAFYLPVMFAVGTALRHFRPDRVLVKNLVVGGLSGVAGTVSWVVPMLVFGGGLDRFERATESLFDFQMTDSFLGNGIVAAVGNGIELLVYLSDALNVLWIAVVLNGIVALRLVRPRWQTLALLAAWVGPPLAMYMHHLPKSGYSLTLAPIGYVVWALTFGAVSTAPIGWMRRLLLGVSVFAFAGYAVTNLVFFTIAVPYERVLYRDAPDVPIHILPGGFTITADYGAGALQYRTRPQRVLWKVVDTFDPHDDLVVYLFGAFDMLRIEQFYHPDQWSIATSEDHAIAWSSPPTNALPMTFGEFQERILRAPDVGVSWDEPSQIDWVEGHLRVSRLGRLTNIDLPRIPKRILVVYKCPPCFIEIGEGIRPVRRRALGAGFDAYEVRIKYVDEEVEPLAMDRPGRRLPYPH